jgi:hypothetical protein
VPDLDAELDALYGAPLAEFVGRRKDLERRLRGAGQSELAGAVGGLSKPSLPAWVVNQLARRDPDGVSKLVDAGNQVAAAQRAGGQAVASATAAHREVLQRLTADLGEAGGKALSDDVRKRVSATLRNASLDPEARNDLVRGRLAAERSATGFDLLADLDLASSRQRKPSTSGARKTEVTRLTDQRKVARAQLATLRAEAESATKEAARVRRDAEQAEARADELEQRLRAQEEALEALAAQLETLKRGE